MAEAPDIELEMYDRIWDLLSADPIWPTLVEPGNRIRYDVNPEDEADDVEGLENPMKDTTSEGDYPQAVLRMMSGEDSLYTNDETFETHSPEGPSHWTEKATRTFRLTVTSQSLGMKESSRLGKLSRNAIRRGGPRLGLQYVTSVTMNWTDREVAISDGEPGQDDQTGGVRRIVHQIDVVVGVEIDGRELLGE